MSMNPEVKAKWVAALKSGEYQQGKQALCSEEGYCCLGVLCELAVKEGIIEQPVASEFWQGKKGYGKYVEYHFLPNEVSSWAGLDRYGKALNGKALKVRANSGRDYMSLADMNDAGVKFSTIARVIEKEF